MEGGRRKRKGGKKEGKGGQWRIQEVRRHAPLLAIAVLVNSTSNQGVPTSKGKGKGENEERGGERPPLVFGQIKPWL